MRPEDYDIKQDKKADEALIRAVEKGNSLALKLYYQLTLGKYIEEEEAEAVEVRAKVELIERALQRFCPFYCPYCQAGIDIGKFVGEDDITFWLEKKKEE